MSILCFGHISLLNISTVLCSIKSQILGYRYQSIDGDHLWWIDSKEIYRFHHNTAPYTLNRISRHSDTTRSTRDVIHVRFAIVERISLFIHTLIRKQSIARCMRIINLKIRISFENQEIDGHINKTFLSGKSQRFCERFFLLGWNTTDSVQSRVFWLNVGFCVVFTWFSRPAQPIVGSVREI